MSKLGIVQRLKDSAQPPQQLGTVMQLQEKAQEMGQQLSQLTRTIAALEERSGDLIDQTRQQTLDLAVLVEPIPGLLHQLQSELQSRDQALAARLDRLEALLLRSLARS